MNRLLAKVASGNGSKSLLLWNAPRHYVFLRNFSANVWYRGALASQFPSSFSDTTEKEESLTLGSSSSFDNTTKSDDKDWSPTTLLCSTPTLEMSNVVSWSYASCFLPTRNDTNDEDDEDITMTMNEPEEMTLGSMDVASDEAFIIEKEEEATTMSSDVNLTIEKETVLVSHNNEILPHFYNDSLPASLQEYYEGALNDERAMVVTSTTSPHTIVDVNHAWIQLCGYTRGEAIDYSIKDLLQGGNDDDQNLQELQDFIDKLSKGQEATVITTNYTKSGRKFTNRIHAGPLVNKHGKVTHFVGVLQEITDADEEERATLNL